MDALPDLLLAAFAEDVHREGGGEGRHGGAARPIGAGHQAQDEEQAHHAGQQAAGRDGGEEAVARLGDAVGGGELIQERPQAQEQGDDRRLQEDAHDQVLLGIPVVLAGQCALHHVLVQPRHRDHRKETAQELFPEELRVVDIVKVKDSLLDSDTAQVLADEDEAQDHRHDHAQGLEDVVPDDGTHAAAEGIRQADAHVADHVQPEGKSQWTEQQQLQRQAHQEQPDGRPQHLGQEEEPGAGPVRAHAEAFFQVLVDGDHVQPEIQRRQDESDDEIAQDEADAHLHVAETAGSDHARHGNEGDARHAGADHRESDDGPVRLAASGVENVLASLPPAGEPGYQGHGDEICD